MLKAHQKKLREHVADDVLSVIMMINDTKKICADDTKLYALVMATLEHLWMEGKIVLKHEK